MAQIPLIQLIYRSDLVGRRETEMASILQSCHYHNKINGITGMLLYSDGSFLQVLEGQPEDVHETFDRICRDPRHCNIVFMTEEGVEERSFAHWSMGYMHLGPEQVAQFPKYARFFQFGFSASELRDNPGTSQELFQMFRGSAQD
ncbi:BLUF domain-containing protein [Candidatus Symbiobacter mobilis]|uniref:BLUF domain protein n=1 Tax=Candidatus Symbiobacter mobilis CR TaxID=946483 RepID=U5N982_9BURK|nr:BLUF domain-containing protein [Candidatus Symbiobacter mobilis]AGX88121.1 BLUF domain protein [Candidatus Symbiobacter mobilis CR]